MRSSRLLLNAILLVFLGTLPLPGFTQQFGESVTQRGEVTEDLYLAGGRVTVAANIAGDLTVAGGRISIDERVEGDVLAFGGSVDLRARVRDDARIAGGEVSVRAIIGDDLLAAGGTLSIAPETIIGGRAWLAGGSLDIGGRIGKGLKAAGGEIIISGEILGDVELVGDTIELRPGARIRGKLTYRSPNPLKIAPEAVVQGSTIRQPLDRDHAEDRHTGAGIFVLFSLFVAAIVLLLLFPRFAPLAAREVRGAPWRSLGLGLAVLAGGPLLIVLLLASVIGLWLGLLALVAYLTLLLLGYLTGILFVAESGLRLLDRLVPSTRTWTIAAIGVTLVLLLLLRLIPVLGVLVTFGLLLAGLGGLSHALWRRYHADSKKVRRSKPGKARK